jgi:hypothetical protein
VIWAATAQGLREAAPGLRGTRWWLDDEADRATAPMARR